MKTENIALIFTVFIFLIGISVQTGVYLNQLEHVTKILDSKTDLVVFENHEKYYEKHYDTLASQFITVTSKLDKISEKTATVEATVKSINERLKSLYDSHTVLTYKDYVPDR